jgi:hypothetical protein
MRIPASLSFETSIAARCSLGQGAELPRKWLGCAGVAARRGDLQRLTRERASGPADTRQDRRTTIVCIGLRPSARRIASSPWRASDHRAGARSRPGARKSPLRSIRSYAVPPFGWQVQRYLLDSVCSAAFGARRIAAEENGCVTVSPSGMHAFDYRVVVEGVGQHQADRVYLGDSSRRRRWFETLLDAIDIAPFGARCRRVGVRPPMIAPSAPVGALNLVLRNIRLGAATATVLSSR